MAKMMKMQSDMMCSPGKCGPKCLLLGLVHAILAAAGLWVLVAGIMKQWSGMMPWSNVVLWYTGGMLLWCLAKMAKKSCCGRCSQ